MHVYTRLIDSSFVPWVVYLNWVRFGFLKVGVLMSFDLALYNACTALITWRKVGLISFDGTTYIELRRLFDVGSVWSIDIASLEMLSGEHGLTVYKILRARHD